MTGSKIAITAVRVNDSICSKPDLMEKELNHLFCSVFSPGQVDPPIRELQDTCGDKIQITKEEVSELLLKLNCKKSSGPDDIPNEFLRHCSDWVAEFLVQIFRASLDTGTLPDDWLMGRVVPIFKGDRFNVNNYRPISITCTVCKLFEHIICKYITDYTETNKIFYDKQHEFRRCLSTVTQLFETVQYFALAINNKEDINVIALDFSKAFDRVCHAKLVRKLYDTGLSPKIV